MGFALKDYIQPSKVNSPAVMEFLKELYLKGEIKGNRKILPDEAMQLLRNAKKECGERKFLRKDWLNENQIRNIYARFGTCKKKNLPLTDSIQIPQDVLEDSMQENVRQQKQAFDEEISNQLENPSSLDNKECPIMASISDILY